MDMKIWENRNKKAMEIIESQKEKSIALIESLTSNYHEATSISDYKRLGLSIRKETLKLERVTSSDYYYKLMETLLNSTEVKQS